MWWLWKCPLMRSVHQGMILHEALPMACCGLATRETPGTVAWRSASPGKKGVRTVGRRCDDGSDSSQVIRKGVAFPTWEEARKAAVTPR